MDKQIIITGDDYGLCAPVNQAIEECLSAGTMGATCVMTNMALYADAAGLRRQFPQRSIGIHWNITQGSPVLKPSAVPSLVGTDGLFSRELRRRWLARQVSRAEIRAELRAQYERFVAIAGAADFWNTHQNSHVFPGLFQFFVAVGSELSIPAMRSHRRFTIPKGSGLTRYLLSHPDYWLKGQVIARWAAAAKARGTRMPDGRIYLPGHTADLTLLQEIAERLPWQKISGAVEWVVHPASSINDKLLGGLTESRLREYELLRRPELYGALRNLGLRCVSFAALASERASEGKAA